MKRSGMHLRLPMPPIDPNHTAQGNGIGVAGWLYPVGIRYCSPTYRHAVGMSICGEMINAQNKHAFRYATAIAIDVDLPTADLLTNLTNTSHFDLPTAVLHGWLHSLMPNGILPLKGLSRIAIYELL